MLNTDKELARVWLIGYGNTQRRDDGLGPYIARRLEAELGQRPELRIQVLHQLDPVLIDDIMLPEAIIFIDATPARLEAGWCFQELQPDLGQWPFAMHHLPPAIFLGLLCMCRRCNPSAFLVTVEGDDFEFGTGLSPAAKARADTAAEALLAFVRLKYLTTPALYNDNQRSRTCKGKPIF